jgi:hypothetical protein
MAEYAPFPREPRTFLKFFQKTRADLIKHLDRLRTPEPLGVDELRMMGRDLQRGLEMLDLAEHIMLDQVAKLHEEYETGEQI